MRPERILLLDPFGGLAGDMFLGGLLDLGLDREGLDRVIESLALPGARLEVEPAERRGIGCTRARFLVPEERAHRHLPEILARIEVSALSPAARQGAAACFRLLAEAEARVHRIEPEEVHFHEVGAMDAILDICSVAHGLDALGVGRVYSGPLPAGTGTVRCAHGELPCPAPATMELLAGFPLVAGEGEGEMVTPTGAALLANFGEPLPTGLSYRPHAAGYGAGSRRASLLRLTLAEADARREDAERDQVVLLETQLDDASGELLAYVMERLLEAGALDVAAAPLTMKKGRPGVALTVMVRPADADRLGKLLLDESGSLGLREQRVERRLRPREVVEVECRLGRARVKVSGPRVAPEYEDCARLAREHGVPLREVMEEVRRAGEER